jgi:hypothetical protein
MPTSTALESESEIVPGRVAGFQTDSGTAVLRARVNVVLIDRPFAEAEMSAVCFVLKDPAVAANAALLEPAPIDTVDGTLTTALLLAKATDTAAAAVPVRETVQEAELFGASVVGMHDKDES